MDLERRLVIEEALLRAHFPGGFRRQGTGDTAGFTGTVRSRSGKPYVLWIPVANFPDFFPEVYIVSPTLHDSDGDLLSSRGTSATMHVLDPDAYGHVQVCHTNQAHWSPRNTLYRVVVKILIWLEAYEAHLRTGQPIDTYVNHMR